MTRPTIDLTAQPITKAEARKALGQEPVGFQAITEPGPICHEGCLAPGSSPHSHSIITGWIIIGPTGTLTLDKDLNGVRSTMVHQFKDGA